MSKSESQALYGIAILCMLFHHLFLNMDPQNYFSVFNEIIGINVIGTIAKLCKICVPIYAFITGYGFSEASKINVGGYYSSKEIVCDFKYSIKHICNLYFKYLLVFIVFIPVGILIGYYEGLTCKKIILSLMGVDYTLNPVWWYVWQYLIFCISYPLINQCVILLEYIKKKQKLEFSKYNLIALVVPGILLLVFFLMGYLKKQNILYFIIFCIGYLSSRCSLVKKARKKKWRNSFFMLLIAIVLSAVIVFIQYLMYTHQNLGVAYILTIFPSILILLNVLESNEKLKRICVFWGKQSTYLWLTHNFFLIMPFVNLIIGISRMAIIKYIILIMLSLMVSYAFGMLDNMVNMKVLKR